MPGQTLFTRTAGASSAAIARVRLTKASLGGAIRGQSRCVEQQPGSRSNVDDRGVRFLEQPRQAASGHDVRSGQVDFHGPAPSRCRGLDHGTAAHDPGCIDQAVDAAERLGSRFDRHRSGPFARHVGLQAIAVHQPRGLGHALLVEVQKRERGALLREQQGCGPADARVGTGLSRPRAGLAAGRRPAPRQRMVRSSVSPRPVCHSSRMLLATITSFQRAASALMKADRASPVLMFSWYARGA